MFLVYKNLPSCILQFYYNPVNGFPTAESKLLLFTPFTVTRFAMHRNHALHDFAPQLSGFL